MKNNETKFYNLNECKTEFLFESDAEKAVLNEASKPKRPKVYKKIIANSILIAILFICITYVSNYYQTTEINKLNASLNNIKNTKTLNEKMNSASNNLKKVTALPNDKYGIIVNKANIIDEQTVANYNMVEVKDNLYNNIKLEEETYNNYLKLKENLMQKGYYINIRSGFRTFNDSKNLYNYYVSKKGKEYAKKYVATPGTSEHNIGLAFDFIISTNKNSYVTNYDSDEYFYLENICYLYGFIIRYPKDKEQITGYSYEPWHLRYVGNDLAKYLKKNNLTLEEYYK